MKKWIGALIALQCLCGLSAAQTASYPDRPITIFVTAAPGGVTDVVARALGQEMTKAWGQPVVIVNRGGAGHILGEEAVSKAEPDGYTLMVAESGSIGHQSAHLSQGQAALRHGERLRADQRAGQNQPGAAGQPFAPGQQCGRTHRAGEEGARQAHLRHGRDRLRAAHEHRAVREHGGRQVHAGALPGGACPRSTTYAAASST